MLTKIKHEYSDILYNPTHFPGPLVCRIRFHCTFALPFNLTIALFVLLRTMASDSSFGILQLLILQAVKSSTVISIVRASQLLARRLSRTTILRQPFQFHAYRNISLHFRGLNGTFDVWFIIFYTIHNNIVEGLMIFLRKEGTRVAQ